MFNCVKFELTLASEYLLFLTFQNCCGTHTHIHAEEIVLKQLVSCNMKLLEISLSDVCAS